MDPRGKEGIHFFHNPHSLFLATTSPKPHDPPTDILSNPSPLTTAGELDGLPRVQMKSGRLVPPLVVAAPLQGARELHRRCVRDGTSEMQPLPPAWPLIPRNEAAYGVEGWEGVERGEAVEGLVRYVVPSYESNDLDFGTSYTSCNKMEELQKRSSVKMEDDKVGVSLEGLLETLKCWDEGSRSTIPDIDEEAATMPQEWGGMIGVMTRTVSPNVDMEVVGVCDVTVQAHYEEKAVGDTRIDGQILRDTVGVGGDVGLGNNEISSFKDFTSFGPASSSYGMIGKFSGGMLAQSLKNSFFFASGRVALIGCLE